MFTHLDHLIVVVKDLKEAQINYEKLFGMNAVWSGVHKELGTSNVLFNFQNTYFELLAATSDGLGADVVNHFLDLNGEGLTGMVFATEDINSVHRTLQKNGYLVSEPSEGIGINTADQQIRKWKNLFLPPDLSRGLFSFVIEHVSGELPRPNNLDISTPHRLDHVVINTNDADGFSKIYKDIFDIRLALDKVIEHWKRRMLFFRINKTTIEVVEKQDTLPPSDRMWGLAWEVKDIEKTYQRLIDQGVEITPIQKGVKEKTLVATVKSHTQNVPTLIIQHLEETD
jgi:catechol 2,3-dioxygenase-like lactoylglutathione lyase family enzyme